MSVGLFLANVHNKDQFVFERTLLYFKLYNLNGTNISPCNLYSKHDASSKKVFRTPFEYYEYLNDVTGTPYNNCSLR